jgi:hypothetical protein
MNQTAPNNIFKSSGITSDNYEAALINFAKYSEDLTKGTKLGAVPVAACGEEAKAARAF